MIILALPFVVEALGPAYLRGVFYLAQKML